VREFVVGPAHSTDQPHLWTIEATIGQDDYARWQQALTTHPTDLLVVVAGGRLLGFPGTQADRLTLPADGGRWKALDLMAWLQTGK